MNNKPTRTKAKKLTAEALEASFPSSRYFQVHFEYLHETINDLKQQIGTANQKIADLQQQLQARTTLDNIACDQYAAISCSTEVTRQGI